MAKPLEEEQASCDPLLEMARGILDGTQMRDAVLGKKIFGEPAWDIFLAVYAAEPRGSISVAELAIDRDFPEEIVRRWLLVLSKNNLVIFDGERAALEAKARQRLRKLLMNMAANLMAMTENFKMG